MPRLEYTGGVSPFVNIESYKQRLRQAYPGISDVGINQAVKKALGAIRERQKGYTRTHFGRDIMVEDVTTIPAWPWLPPSHRRRIREHPLNGGAIVNDNDPKYTQVELAGAYNRASVNRSVLISPKGLENTYVWCSQNQWMQELTQGDYDLIMSFRSFRWLFQDPDEKGLFIPTRSYEAPVLEKHVAHDMGDVKRLMKHHSRTNHVLGVDSSDFKK